LVSGQSTSVIKAEIDPVDLKLLTLKSTIYPENEIASLHLHSTTAPTLSDKRKKLPQYQLNTFFGQDFTSISI